MPQVSHKELVKLQEHARAAEKVIKAVSKQLAAGEEITPVPLPDDVDLPVLTK